MTLVKIGAFGFGQKQLCKLESDVDAMLAKVGRVERPCSRGHSHFWCEFQSRNGEVKVRCRTQIVLREI